MLAHNRITWDLLHFWLISIEYKVYEFRIKRIALNANLHLLLTSMKHRTTVQKKNEDKRMTVNCAYKIHVEWNEWNNNSNSEKKIRDFVETDRKKT